MNIFHTFKNLSLYEKVGVTAAAFGGFTVAVKFVASTDTVQKIHIKYKLLNMKFPKPPHMEMVTLFNLNYRQLHILIIIFVLFM